MRIFAGFHRDGAPNDTGVDEIDNFHAFSWLFLGKFQTSIKAHIIIQDTCTSQSLVGFSVIPKCMSLNDPELLFHIKLWFACRLRFPASTLLVVLALSTLSQKSATVAENGETTATVALFCASVDRLLLVVT